MGGRGGHAFKTKDVRKSEAFFGLNSSSGMYNSWRDKLSRLEFAAVQRYTGDDYRDINDALRISGLSRASPDIRQCVEDMTRALSNFNLKKSITVFRGAGGAIFGGNKTVEEINAMAKAGVRLRDNGFMSTSASQGANFSGKYQFIITVPAGVGRGAYVAPLSHYRSENEFLLQRGTTFKITKAVQNGRITEVHLRVELEKKKKK